MATLVRVQVGVRVGVWPEGVPVRVIEMLRLLLSFFLAIKLGKKSGICEKKNSELLPAKQQSVFS